MVGLVVGRSGLENMIRLGFRFRVRLRVRLRLRLEVRVIRVRLLGLVWVRIRFEVESELGRQDQTRQDKSAHLLFPTLSCRSFCL